MVVARSQLLLLASTLLVSSCFAGYPSLPSNRRLLKGYGNDQSGYKQTTGYGGGSYGGSGSGYKKYDGGDSYSGSGYTPYSKDGKYDGGDSYTNSGSGYTGRKYDGGESYTNSGSGYTDREYDGGGSYTNSRSGYTDRKYDGGDSYTSSGSGYTDGKYDGGDSYTSSGSGYTQDGGDCIWQGDSYKPEEWAECTGYGCTYNWCQCLDSKWTNCKDEYPYKDVSYDSKKKDGGDYGSKKYDGKGNYGYGSGGAGYTSYSESQY